MTRLDLLERVNQLNVQSDPGVTYWTVTVMYNTVIYRRGKTGRVTMREVIEGVPK